MQQPAALKIIYLSNVPVIASLPRLCDIDINSEKDNGYYSILAFQRNTNTDTSSVFILTEPVGCGKTTLMMLMNQLLPTHHRHIVRACREIAFEFATQGFEAIQRYTRGSFNQYTEHTVAYCFDDLGLEPVVQHYGNICNVMAEILLSRYDFYIRYKMLTHITTNMNSREIEDCYGARVRSRCREMFNLISFNVNSMDKRS